MVELVRSVSVVASTIALAGVLACPVSAQNRQCRDGEQVSISGTIFHIQNTNKGAAISTLNRGETTGTCSGADIIFEGAPPKSCVRAADFTVKGKAIATWRIVATSLECREGLGFMVFFDHEKTAAEGEATKVIEEGAKSIKSSGARFIWVIGYADASEHERMPKGFPVSRAESVKASLVRNGVAPEEIVVMSSDKGEMPVQTASGVKEPSNRRVFVRIIN